MEGSRILARVILRSDGSVHIAFPDTRAIQATTENLLALFSDPMEFIGTGSCVYEDTTSKINRKRTAIEKILGLTLAVVNTDKQIVCDFPELFRFMFSNLGSEEDRAKKLNMNSFCLEKVLPDEKSFLLRYYLDFTSKLKPDVEIRNNIKLRDEIQFEIMREVLNMYFEGSDAKPSKTVQLSEVIVSAESEAIYEKKPESRMVGVVEYAKLLGVGRETVLTWAKKGLIKSAVKTSSGHWQIDSNDRPIDWDLRKGRERKGPKEANGKFYKRPSEMSAADIQEHILKLNLFSAEVAPYIRTPDELDYYVDKNYHEIKINGKPCLVLNVNPDYISSKTGKSNRDLMREGKPPVCPERDREEHIWHVHHIGQTSKGNFPIAIIPDYIHNNHKYNAILHPGSSGENVHTAEFEAMKKSFWKGFLAAYEAAGGNFDKIPYCNPKRKRGQKK